MVRLSNTLSWLFGFISTPEPDVLKGSTDTRLTVTLTDGTRIESPDQEIKITPKGEVYFKVQNKWVLDSAVKTVVYIAK